MDISTRTKRIVLGLVIVLAGIQLIPVWLWQKNPPVSREPTWDSPETRALARGACFDCHSNQTAWPLYARVAPVSWLVTWDVLKGRDELNFSAWGVARREGGEVKGAEDAAKQIREGEMPPGLYAMMHAAARLDDATRTRLIRGLQASLGAGPASAGPERGERGEAGEERERR